MTHVDRFLNDVKALTGRQAIQLICQSGGKIQIEKSLDNKLNMFYFPEKSIVPTQSRKTDFETIEWLLTSTQRQAC